MSESTTRVIHVRDMAKYPDAIYIGRSMPRQGLKGSPFANPYKIGGRSEKFEGNGPNGTLTRLDAIQIYAWDLYAGEKTHLFAELPALRGKALACWCRHDGEAPTDENQCHGDVLAELINGRTDDELRAMVRGGVE
jgi:hypothetical protein